MDTIIGRLIGSIRSTEARWRSSAITGSSTPHYQSTTTEARSRRVRATGFSGASSRHYRVAKSEESARRQLRDKDGRWIVQHQPFVGNSDPTPQFLEKVTERA